MRMKVQITLERNGYKATSELSVIDRILPDALVEIEAEIRRLSAACAKRDNRRLAHDQAVEAYADEWRRQAETPNRLTSLDRFRLNELRAAVLRATEER